MWAFAGLPDALPEGSYRLDPAPEGADPTRIALGWALGTYAFTRYHAEAARAGPALAWPDGADRAPGRTAGPRDLPRARPDQHAGRGSWGRKSWPAAASRLPSAAGACHRVIVGDELLAENYPTIHAVGRASSAGAAAGRHRLGRRGGAEGDPGRQGRVLRHRRARPQDRLRHASDEEGHGRRGDRARARPGDHGCEAAGPAARAAAAVSRTRCRATPCGRSTSSARARG